MIKEINPEQELNKWMSDNSETMHLLKIYNSGMYKLEDILLIAFRAGLIRGFEIAFDKTEKKG